MRRAQWAFVLAVGVIGAGIGLDVAFEREKAPLPLESAPPRPVGSFPLEPSRRRVVDTSPAESAVADFRSRALSPQPQAEPSALIAISGTRVGRIEPDALVVVEPGTNKQSLTLTLPGAFAVTASPGALLAVGRDRLLVLGNGERKPRSMPRPSLFPGSRMMPDLIDPTRVWVRHPQSNSLFGYSLSESTSVLLPLVETVPLSGAPEGSFLALGDGAFLHFTGTAWERLFVQGKRFNLSWPTPQAKPFRALRAHRLDQIYVFSSDGQLALYQLDAPLVRLWSRNLGALPVDAATSGERVFLLRAERTDGKQLSWGLQRIHRKESDGFIPLDGSEEDVFRGDWHAQLLARYALAASPRWVVLGGGGQLRVWDAKTLDRVEVPAK